MSKRILVVSPHPDDETLGAGGTIAKFSAAGHKVTVLVVSGHLPPLYKRDVYDETVREAMKAFALLGVSESHFLEIPATKVHEQPVCELNSKIEAVAKEIDPHIVLCPFPDRHIDHRTIFDSSMVMTRPLAARRSLELVAAYETLSETHWNASHIEPNFTPNWVVDISAHIDTKKNALACYASQIQPFPAARSIEAAEALAKFRGTQAGFAFGEGFHIIRMTS